MKAIVTVFRFKAEVVGRPQTVSINSGLVCTEIYQRHTQSCWVPNLTVLLVSYPITWV